MLLNGLTFELRIMLRKRRMKIEEHKSGIRRRLTIILPAQEAKTGQPLTPMLGQVQISTANFVNEFNRMSLIFENGFPLHVEILVYWEKRKKKLNIPLIYCLFLLFILLTILHLLYQNIIIKNIFIHWILFVWSIFLRFYITEKIMMIL